MKFYTLTDRTRRPLADLGYKVLIVAAIYSATVQIANRVCECITDNVRATQRYTIEHVHVVRDPKAPSEAGPMLQDDQEQLVDRGT